MTAATAEVWANPAWMMRKRHEIDADERAAEARESADFAASQVLMNVAPAHQAPYRAEVVIRSAGAMVHAEVLMVTGIAARSPRKPTRWHGPSAGARSCCATRGTGHNPLLTHRIGNAEAPCDCNELAHPRGARRGVASIEQRVDRDQKLGPIVHREAPIGVREADGNGIERERKAVHVELCPRDGAGPTDVELKTEDIA